MRWMRSTSTSYNPGERGLFRLLVGAAFALAGWRAFWKWALPKKGGVLSTGNFNAIMKDMYLKPLQEQLNYEVNGLLNLMSKDVNRQGFGSGLGHVSYVPLTKWEKRKRKFKRWLKGYKPVIMTTKKKEELEDYY